MINVYFERSKNNSERQKKKIGCEDGLVDIFIRKDIDGCRSVHNHNRNHQ